MGLWDIISHPRRYLDLYDAYKRLQRNWRNPEMDKLRQREFWMPFFMAVVTMANDVFDLGMSEETLHWAAGMVAVAVAGLVVRKFAVKPPMPPKQP